MGDGPFKMDRPRGAVVPKDTTAPAPRWGETRRSRPKHRLTSKNAGRGWPDSTGRPTRLRPAGGPARYVCVVRQIVAGGLDCEGAGDGDSPVNVMCPFRGVSLAGRRLAHGRGGNQSSTYVASPQRSESGNLRKLDPDEDRATPARHPAIVRGRTGFRWVLTI